MSTDQSAFYDLLSSISGLLLWWVMVEAEKELAGEPPIADNAVILHFMGCGASHSVLASDFRAMMKAAQRIDTSTQG